MSGQTSVRTAEDFEGGALTYAEIKAIASGNPAVMEKVKIDTEVRKLDQLRAAHLNQQHGIRWELRDLPEKIDGSKQNLAHLKADIATRDAHEAEEFIMTVGGRTFSGKGAREEAAQALTRAALAHPTDFAIRSLGTFHGLEILSRAKMTASVPDLFIRGEGTYLANLNADNPVGTMQSIEHTLRALDRMAEKEQERAGHLQKTLADFQGQAGRPFEHEARLRELVARQAELDKALDLDKGEQQVAAEAEGEAEAGANQNADARTRGPVVTRRDDRDGRYTARRRPDTGGEPDEEADEAEVENVPKPWGGPKLGL
jgi:hypothetical protein